MTDEERREMMRNNYAAQMEMLGYDNSGNPIDIVQKAKQMRLIDANVLLEQMKARQWYVGRASDAVCLVEDAPTVDAVPVVRCKECKYAIESRQHGEYPFCCTHYEGPIDQYCDLKADWFCADGEKVSE